MLVFTQSGGGQNQDKYGSTAFFSWLPQNKSLNLSEEPENLLFDTQCDFKQLRKCFQVFSSQYLLSETELSPIQPGKEAKMASKIPHPIPAYLITAPLGFRNSHIIVSLAREARTGNYFFDVIVTF